MKKLLIKTQKIGGSANYPPNHQQKRILLLNNVKNMLGCEKTMTFNIPVIYQLL